MKRIAVANLKGGVGKSTTTVFLAEHWALEGDRVLVIDLDPQASTSSMLLSEEQLINAERARRCFPDFLADGRAAEATGSGPPDLEPYLIPRCSDLTDLNLDRTRGCVALLPAVPKLWFDIYESDRLSYISGHDPIDRLTRLLDGALSRIASQYDFVLIDCPPGFGTLSRVGLGISQYIVAPTIADYVSTKSLHDFRFSGLTRMKIDPSDKLFVVVSKYTDTNFQRRTLDLLRKACHVIDPPVKMVNDVYLASENLSGRWRTYTQKYGSFSNNVRPMTLAVKRAILSR